MDINKLNNLWMSTLQNGKWLPCGPGTEAYQNGNLCKDRNNPQSRRKWKYFEDLDLEKQFLMDQVQSGPLPVGQGEQGLPPEHHHGDPHGGGGGAGGLQGGHLSTPWPCPGPVSRLKSPERGGRKGCEKCISSLILARFNSALGLKRRCCFWQTSTAAGFL